jgi:hypothetical protein
MTKSRSLRIEQVEKPDYFIYLPKEGLQGEDIPSYILWENAKIGRVAVSFQSPLRLAEIFNDKSSEKGEDTAIIHEVKLEGYVGFSFETYRVEPIEVESQVEFILQTTDGKIIKETKKINLFKPKLDVKPPPTNIEVDPKTGFVKGRIRIKNSGRGLIIMHITETKDSPLKVETPPEHQEFAAKFEEDVTEEMGRIAEEFPNFKTMWEQMLFWDTKEFLELTEEERTEYAKFIVDLARTLASDKRLLQSFIEGYAKAFAKNTELIEMVRRVINVYESLVSKDLLLTNPLDEITLPDKSGQLILAIRYTDRVFHIYEDIILPNVQISGSQDQKIPIYKLFEWGK